MERRPTTQDLSWFLDLDRNNQLDLDPPYQRRSVWTVKDKKFFLDTIFRGYPCPAIFLHKTIDDNGVPEYHVVDGKQRLGTVLDFVNNKLTIDKNFGDATLAGKKWKDLSDPEIKKKFWNYIFTVEMLDIVEGTVVNEVFDRLNRNSRRLESQELRHAKFDGWFINVAEAEAEKEEWKTFGVVTTTRAKRMKDVQFISELLFLMLEKEVVGFDQDYLDKKYAEYDNPQETKIDFSEERFYEKLESTKRTLMEMQRCNSCIEMYAKTFSSFYTLWSVLVLESELIPEPKELAERYAAFMCKVIELNAQEDKQQFLTRKGGESEQYRNPLRYVENSLGASTDLAQRLARTEALKDGLLVKR